MYTVFAEGLADAAGGRTNTVQTLEQAFAEIACRCGLSYRFVASEEGWTLEMTDVERPDRSPEPIHTSYKRPRDAQHDLMTQAVDGRVRGHVALRDDLFGHARITHNAQARACKLDDRP